MERSVIAVCIVGLLLISGFGFYQYHKTEEHAKEFTVWARKCKEIGGSVEITAYNWADCTVNGKIVILPGYEDLQRDRPN